MLFSKNKPLDFGLIKRFLFGADDGTFVAARSAFRQRPRSGRRPAAPRLLLFPTKSFDFAGSPFAVGSSPHHKAKEPPIGRLFCLVRMMGLEPTGYCYH